MKDGSAQDRRKTGLRGAKSEKKRPPRRRLSGQYYLSFEI
jgi:hypothetical protein